MEKNLRFWWYFVRGVLRRQNIENSNTQIYKSLVKTDIDLHDTSESYLLYGSGGKTTKNEPNSSSLVNFPFKVNGYYTDH